MRKLARSQMRSWAQRHLKVEQNGLCPLCAQPIDLSIKGEGVIDHDHDTGRIRGVLHRSCNAAEGKAANAISRWGSKSATYEAIIAFATRLLAYWNQVPTEYIYPMHLTPEEKAIKAKAKARVRVATKRAAARIKEVS